MGRASNTVTIARSIRDVFDFLADGHNNASWQPEVEQTSLVSGPATSAIWLQTVKRASGRVAKGDYRVSDYEEPSLIEFTVFAGSPQPIVGFSLRSLDAESTEVIMVALVQPRWLPIPLASAGRVAAEREVAKLEHLKTALEA
jgi:uncharacterized protein YndB with AHSA1/START domain